VIIFPIIFKKSALKEVLAFFYGGPLGQENYLNILTMPFDREFKN